MIKIGDTLTLNCGDTVTIEEYCRYPDDSKISKEKRLEFIDSKGMYRDHLGRAHAAGDKYQPLGMVDSKEHWV